MSSDDKHPQLGAGILVHRKIRRRREGEDGEGDAPRATGAAGQEGPPSRVQSPRVAREDLWSGDVDPFGDDPFALDPFAPLPPEEPEELQEPEEEEEPLELYAPLAQEPAVDPGLDVTLDPTTAWARDRATVEFRPPPGMLESADDFFDDASMGPARSAPEPAPSRSFNARALDYELLDPFASSLRGEAPAAASVASPDPASPEGLFTEDTFDWSGGSWDMSSPAADPIEEALDGEGVEELEALLAERLDDTSTAGDLSIVDLSNAHRIEHSPPRPPLSRSISHRSDDWQREALEELSTRLQALESSGVKAADASTLRGVLAPRWGTLDAQDGVITAGLAVVYEVDAWLLAAQHAGAQGLVLASGTWPVFQTEDGVERGPGPALTLARWEALLRPLCSARSWEQLVRDGAGVLEHRLPDGACFRVALSWGAGAAVAVFQRQLRAILGVVDLGLPREAEGLLELCGGLVVVAGPLGSGRRATLAALLRGWEARHGGRALVFDPRPRFELSALGVSAQERMPGLHGATLEAMLPTLTRERPERVAVVDGDGGRALAEALLEVVWGGGLAVVVVRAATVEAALAQLTGGDPALYREVVEALSGLLCLRRVPLSQGGAGIVAASAVVDAPLGEALLSRRGDVESWLRANPAGHRQSLGVALEGWISRGWCEPEAASAALAGQPTWQAALLTETGGRA